MRLAPALLAVALLAAALAAPLAASAAAPRVVVLAAAAEQPLAARLADELGTVGFEVLVRDAPAGPFARASLDDAARAEEAIAAVRVVPSRAGLEVWIVDRVTGKTVLRDVVVDAGEPGREGLIALRAVELLRASLMEIDAPHAPRGEAPPPPELRAIAKLPEPLAIAPPAPNAPLSTPLLHLDLAPAIVGAPGGLPPFAALSFGVHLPFARRFGAEAAGFVPLTSLHHEADEGSSTSRLGLATLGLRVSLGAPASRWIPDLGGGAALLWFSTEGVGAAPRYVGISGSSFGGGVYLRPGLAFAISPRFRVRADALIGTALRAFVLDYAGRDAASWGTPFFAGSLGVEMGVP